MKFVLNLSDGCFNKDLSIWICITFIKPLFLLDYLFKELKSQEIMVCQVKVLSISFPSWWWGGGIILLKIKSKEEQVQTLSHQHLRAPG